MKPSPSSEKTVVTDRRQYLAKERRRLFGLAPEATLDAILDHSQAMALVHSIPEQDILALIHEVGSEDAMELIALTSDRQREYIIDVETWNKDRLTPNQLTLWMGRFLEASPDHSISWLLREKSDLLSFYLSQALEVRVREHDEDPSDFGPDFETLDNVYYMRLKPAFKPIESASPEGDPLGIEIDKIEMDRREPLIKSMLARMAGFDHRQYQAILLESTNLIAAEQEETLYRWRNVRLAEKGFVPFDEALGVYQALDTKTIQPLKVPKGKALGDKNYLPVPLVYDRQLTGKDRFQRVLRQLRDPYLGEHLQIEFTTLANQVAAADQTVVRERQDLESIAAKVSGYLSIGLEQLGDPSEGSQATELASDRTALAQFALADIFRVGFGCALKLKWQAQRWLENAWYRQAGFPLTFWDESWTGILGGLLIKKPLYFDNYHSGTLYREFNSLSDIATTHNALQQIVATDRILSRFKIDLTDLPKNQLIGLSYKSLVLTLWVRAQLGLPPIPEALPLTAFMDFYGFLFDGGKHLETTVSSATKRAFADWLSDATDLSQAQIAQRAGPVLEALFSEIEAELGQVPASRIDPRYIRLFWLENSNP